MTESQKGIFHLFLALAATMEVLTSQSRKRSLLLGAMAGWHAILAAEHFTDTEETPSPTKPCGFYWRDVENCDNFCERCQGHRGPHWTRNDGWSDGAIRPKPKDRL